MSYKALAEGGLRPLIEVAAEHGLSYSVLLRLVMTQRVVGARRGRSWLADSGDVQRWKAEQTESVA
jgi:hypothetical protein